MELQIASCLLGRNLFGLALVNLFKRAYVVKLDDKYDLLVDLLTVVLVLIAVAVAVLGYAIFRIVHDTLIKETTDLVEEARQEVEKHVEEARIQVTKQITTERDRLEEEANRRGAILYDHQAYAMWLYWSKQKGARDLLDMAIDWQKQALELANKVALMKIQEDLRLIKNNRAFYLAERGLLGDMPKAYELVTDMYQQEKAKAVPDLYILETYAYVLKRFPRSDQDLVESKEIIEKIKSRPDVPDDLRRQLEERYKEDY